MNTYNTTITLGRMAIDHQARSGLRLQQDPRTGAWRIETAFEKLNMLQLLRRAKIFKNGWFRMGIAGGVGAMVAIALSQLSFQQDVALPIAAPTPSPYEAPETIQLASSSYAIEVTDPQKLPPPIEVAGTTLPTAAPTTGDEATGRAAKLPVGQGTVANNPGQQKTPPPVTPAAQTLKPSPLPPAAAPSLAGKATQSQVAANNRLPPPVPQQRAAAAVPPQRVSTPERTPIARDDVKDEGKLTIFNEPLPLSKAPAVAPANLVSQLSQSSRSSASEAKPAVTPNASKATLRLLAVQSSNAIVVTNPSTKLPVIVNIGQPLPDGSTLKSVDKAASTAVNSRGEVLVLQ